VTDYPKLYIIKYDKKAIQNMYCWRPVRDRVAHNI